MLLICTPTIRTGGGVAEEIQTWLAAGGFIERTPQEFSAGGGFSHLTSTLPFTSAGGMDILATPTSWPLSIGGGFTTGSSPKISIGGGVAETIVRNFSAQGGFSELLQVVTRLNGGGFMARLSLEMAVGGGFLQRLPGAFEVGGGIDLGLVPAAELPAVFNTWVLNMQAGHSRYDNFPFTGMMELDGIYLACGPGGLFRLDGETDNGTPTLARITTGITNSGTEMKKRAPDLYLTARSAEGLQVRLAHDETKVQEQVAQGLGSSALREVKIPLGKSNSLDFNRVQVEITNPSGGDFEVSQAELIIVASANRRSR